MIRNVHCIRAAVAVTLLAAFVGRVRAQEGAEDLYARTLGGTALILTPTGSGTGWVFDLEKGLLVTNDHVVGPHAEVDVVFPARGPDSKPVAELAYYQRNAVRARAEVIDADGPRDLAVVRLRERPPAGVTALRLAAADPRPAERVHSIGNPSLSGALWVYSTGTVRQVYHKDWRYASGPVRSARVIETQSPINPGDSGGPVVNDAGEVVGVVSGRQPEASLVSWCIAGAEVRAYLEEAQELIEPKTASAFRRRGLRALQRGAAARAVEDLSAAHRLDPESADVLAERAAAFRVRGDFDLALDDVAEALRLDPRHAGAHNVRGCIHTDRNETDAALAEFRVAIRLDPRVGLFHANRAQAHLNKGEVEAAVRSYDEALRLTPGVAEWHFRRGLAREQLGNREGAGADYAEAVRLDPAYRERLTLHTTRVVRVANRTAHTLRVHLRYETQAPDGSWAWLPGEGDLVWEFAPGETAVLVHDNRPVLARRMRIWADSPDTETVWHGSKDRDTWTAPAAGYRSGAEPEPFTFTFNP